MSDKRAQRRLISRFVGAAIGLLLLAGFVWFVHAMMGIKTSKQQRLVQTIQVIRPPPPPPPDQPPPPPPEKTQEQLPKDQPQPTPDQPDQAPDQPLGVDAEGSAGGDAFGLAARRGGADLIGGSGTAPFAWYTNRMGADGHVKQIKLTSSTGNQRLDECFDKALASITSMSDAPPPGMPEQVNLRVVF